MSYQLNEKIKDVWAPERIRRLPISRTGYYVPWFVAWIDNEPDFRVIGPGKIEQAVKRKLCWVCGQTLGQFNAFPIGPMCAVNRTISEPPSHLDCAEYSARACPFLSNPSMRRNTKDLPEEGKEPAGFAIKRNPGVTCIWVTKDFKPMKVGNGVLFKLGEPTSVQWFAEGKKATRAQVSASVESGLPILMDLAQKEGELAVTQLVKQLQIAEKYFPAE